MPWDALLREVMVLLHDGRSNEERAAHKTSIGRLLGNMARTGHLREVPVRTTLALVGDRWTALILELLSGGRMRHSELRHIIDLVSAEQEISQRVLTLKLRTLERNGLVARRVSAGATPRVDYALTERGHELARLVEALVRWSDTNTEAILASRRDYDARVGDGDL